MDDFCEMLSSLKGKQEIKNFLKDLLNRKERLMTIRRLLIADLLEQKVKYREIRERLKCGQGTISKVQRWLRFGRGGYRVAIKARKK